MPALGKQWAPTLGVDQGQRWSVVSLTLAPNECETNWEWSASLCRWKSFVAYFLFDYKFSAPRRAGDFS